MDLNETSCIEEFHFADETVFSDLFNKQGLLFGHKMFYFITPSNIWFCNCAVVGNYPMSVMFLFVLSYYNKVAFPYFHQKKKFHFSYKLSEGNIDERIKQIP